MNVRKNLATIPPIVFTISLLALTAVSQERQASKSSSYAVGPGAVVSITNNYGPVSVKPSGSSQVVVETVSHSDSIRVVNEQHGDRIELRSTSSRPGTNLVDYTVLVPAAVFVSVRSSDGSLRVQGLSGDVVLEAASGSVEVTNISDAHLHVKTLSGPISLTDISNSHLDIHSVSGDVDLHNVAGPSVDVNSGSGRITYDGDPGRIGEYLLSSHSGSEPAISEEDESVRVLEVSAVGRERDEDFRVPQVKIFPQNPYDRARLPVERYGSSKYLRITGEVLAPSVIGQDCDGGFG